MRQRMRRVLGIRSSGAAGRHRTSRDDIPRPRKNAQALEDQVENGQTDHDGELIEDPESAEEEVTLRDAKRGVGPRPLRDDMTMGEFLDGLPPDGVETSVFVNGQWWNVMTVGEVGPDDEQGKRD